jgi:hypothetical protein
MMPKLIIDPRYDYECTLLQRLAKVFNTSLTACQGLFK